MKRLALALVLFAALQGIYVFPQQQQNQQKLQPVPARRNAVIPRRLVMEDLVIAFYVNQFQKQVDVTDEVFGKITSFFREFVQNRFEISNRRQRALNQLRQTAQRGGSDEELKRASHEFDMADADSQANQERFLNNVDPLLNARQQARLRLFQVQADNRMRQMLEEAQNQAQQRQNAAPPQPN